MSKFTFLDSAVMSTLFAVRHTLRFNKLNPPNIHGPAVLVCWHDELLPITHALRHQPTIALVSGKRAGRALSTVMQKMGHKVVNGSSTRDGLKAVKKLLSEIDNNIIMVACDGPRGPRHRMKPGGLFIAEKANVPLYLVRVKYKGWRINKSWDKFLLPYPFSKVEFIVEAFDHKADHADKDARLAAAEKRLSAMQG